VDVGSGSVRIRQPVRASAAWVEARRILAASAGPARAARAAAAPAARPAAAPEEVEAGAAALGCVCCAICAQEEVGRGGKWLK